MLVRVAALAASYTVTVPGGAGFFPIANQLDNGMGNTLEQLLPVTAEGAQIYYWNCAAQDFSTTVPTYHTATIPHWSPPGTLVPGEGAFIVNPSAAPIMVTFSGTPVVPVLPSPFSCGCGRYSLLSSQTAALGTWGTIVGGSPPEGALFMRWNYAVQTFVTNTFTNCFWSGGPPIAQVGETVMVFIPCTSNLCCLQVTCATNLVVECGSPWNFTAPTASSCCDTSVNITVLRTVTNGICPQFAIRTWLATDSCGNSNICSQTVAIVDTTPPTITCSSNKTVECGSAWTFDLPTVFDTCSGTNIPIGVLSTVTNGICPLFITRTWLAMNLCGSGSTCTQTVTVVDTTPPIITCSSNKTAACTSCFADDNFISDRVLWNFSSLGPDGQQPQCALIEGFDGALYGSASDTLTPFSGTLFKQNKDGSGFTVLHTFSGSDGRNPYAGLCLASDTLFYGTTFSGGPGLNGTVFKFDGVTLTTIHGFSGTDGYGPQGGVIEGIDGALYGGTYGGGASGSGNLFKLARTGAPFSVLHDFAGGPTDGANAVVRLAEGSDGFLYGVTPNGGSNSVGVLFKISKAGLGYQILYNFGQSATDGKNPLGALVEGSSLALYGTTSAGGANGQGTIFTINKDGSGYATLYSFASTATDGQSPVAGLIIGADSGLYGTTRFGGAGSRGTAFRMDQAGTGYKTLYSFMAGGDASNPYASLLQGSDGALYGTTLSGGTNGTGTVFKLDCAWRFDPPAAFDACCTNVTLSVLSTVTNEPCPHVITRTWQAMDCCSNTATCSQSLTFTTGTCVPPVITHIYYTARTFTLIFQSQPCLTYQVQYKNSLTDPVWSVLVTLTATGTTTTVQDTAAPNFTRFYRVVCLACP
jgi:uncharacterized repeat protein (TIGR03803 family)